MTQPRIMARNQTHDPKAQSWLDAANAANTDFPIQNLPFGSFRLRHSKKEDWRLGIAIGDQVLDLKTCVAIGLFPELEDGLRRAMQQPKLDALFKLGPAAWSKLRLTLFNLLVAGRGADARRTLASPALMPLAGIELQIPMTIGDYTDFFASLHHARRSGRIVRGATDVAANFRHVPIGYHGRASSIRVSGTLVKRPAGQRMPAGASMPEFAPTERLDFELEIGIVIGTGNELGKPIPVQQAADHIFGYCLLNDWSARDIQAWEYQPLGPFLGKSFLTSISPWIVTREALLPFEAPLEERETDAPPPLAYLKETAPSVPHFKLMASVQGQRVTSSSSRYLYWSPAQLIAHHTSNGCNLCAGDLLGTGTVSGPRPEECACLMELTEGGKTSINIGLEQCTYLRDDDEVTLTARAEAEGARSIGFGACTGRVT